MKKILILSMLISFMIICSCQKQDSAAEQELAQRKTQLDARENALLGARLSFDGEELPLRSADAKLAVLPDYAQREELGELL